jgi:hypothetical protein
MAAPKGFHRGDHVLSFATGQCGVVEGWKGQEVLVHWGTAHGRIERSWVNAAELIPATDDVFHAWVNLTDEEVVL